MINLLPPQDKKNLLIDYRLRLAVVGLSFVCGGILIGLILLIPSYFISSYESSVASGKMDQANKDTLQKNHDLTAQVQAIRQKVAVLEVSGEKIQPTDIIAMVVADRGPNHVTAVTYSLEDNTVSVQGNAESRQSLVQFTDALKMEKNIASVDLPISSLAQDTNVAYSIKITLKK